jgi:hypothetical protein
VGGSYLKEAKKTQILLCSTFNYILKVKVIKENLKRHITGTKTPKNGRLLWTIIFIILFFIIGNFSGFYLNDKWDEWTATSEIDVIMPTQLNGDILPIKIKNTGETDLTNIKVNISSCDMEDFNIEYPIQDLKPNEEVEIPFKEIKTINNLKKLDCNNFYNNYSEYGVWIDVYLNDKKEVFVPEQNKQMDVCGYCFYNINITSDELTENFREHTFSTIQLDVSLGKKKEANPPLDNWTKSPIRISVFDDRTYNRLISEGG